MIKGVVESIVDVIYPPLCICCKKPYQRGQNVHLCGECYFTIKRHIPPFCRSCGRGLEEIDSVHSGICTHCIDKKYSFDKGWSLCGYEGLLKDVIHDFKYKQKLHYKTIFAQLLKEFMYTYKLWDTYEVIIPIPLHAVKLREREYNQSAILAQCIGALFQIPIRADCLERIRNTKPQFNLDEQSRIRNIKGCFRVKNGQMLRSQSILIVDDVFTTGATLSEAARMIREYDPNTIDVFTIAS